MKIKAISLILLISSFICKQSYAQSQQIVPVSPEAAALSKMINYPVNLNSGIPDISIPLYQVETGGMTLPITLNYHSGGFRINEKATSVGLGWSLSSDIQITRTVNGLDDFTSTNGYISNTRVKTYYGGQFSSICTECDYPLGTGMNEFGVASGTNDGMPDKFNYKLLNKSGSFYFRKTNSGTGYTIVPVPFDNIKIEFSENAFTITDTDGTKYYFGVPGPWGNLTPQDRGFELSGSFTQFGGCADCKIAAWKCKKIENPTKTENITFAYQPKSLSTFTRHSDRIEYYNNPSPCVSSNPVFSWYNSTDQTNYNSYENLIALEPFYKILSPKYYEYTAGGGASFTIAYTNVQKQVLKKTYPVYNTPSSTSITTSALAVSAINYKGGSVIFSGTDELNSIAIKGDQDQEIRSFVFFQSYAKANDMTIAKRYNGDSFNGTLYLDSIQIKNNDRVYQRYKLLYKEKFCFGNHLRGQDAWGYVNASTQEIGSSYMPPSSIPSQYITQLLYLPGKYCSNSELSSLNIGGGQTAEFPSINHARKGMLSRIIYPTGGFVNFEFEHNKFNERVITSDKESQSIRMAGGLRINSISYFDGDRKMVNQKYYRYGELEDGVGLVINAPARNFNTGRNEYEPFKVTQNVNYLKTSNSNPCGHRGCLVNIYSETKDTYLPASSIDYTYPGGAPVYYTKVTEYNSDLGINTGKKVYTYYEPTKFLYASEIGSPNMAAGTNIPYLHTDGFIGAQKSVGDYKMESGKLKLVHLKEYWYDKYVQPEQVSVVYSFFKNIYIVAEGNFTGSQEDLYNVNPIYNPTSGTKQGSRSDYISGEYGLQVGKLLLVKEQEKWINNSDTVSKVVRYKYNDSLFVKPSGSGSRNNYSYLQPSSIITYNAKGDEITTDLKYVYDFPGISIYNKMKSLNRIDQVIEETTRNSSTGQEISKVRTNYEEFSDGTGFIAPSSIQKSTKGATLQTEVTFKEYRNANLVELIGKDKVTKTYLWGYGYKYPVAELTGTTYSVLSSKINIAQLQTITDELQLRTALNNLIAAIPDAFIRTFTYKPWIGMKSQTAPNGMVKYYDYDNFGRLSVIRNHKEQVLKQYEYNETGPVTIAPYTLFSTNVPIMRPFLDYYDPGPGRIFGMRVIPGGTTNNDNVEQATLDAENYFTNSPVRYIESYISYPFSERVGVIKLKVYMIGVNTPSRVDLDLIQNETIMFTEKFPYVSSETREGYLKAGQYKMSMRLNSNYNSSTLKYFVQPSSGAGFYALPGDMITITEGVTYTITVSNAL